MFYLIDRIRNCIEGGIILNHMEYLYDLDDMARELYRTRSQAVSNLDSCKTNATAIFDAERRWYEKRIKDLQKGN